VEHHIGVKRGNGFDERLQGKAMGTIWTQVATFLELGGSMGRSKLATTGRKGHVFLHYGDAQAGIISIIFTADNENRVAITPNSAVCEGAGTPKG